MATVYIQDETLMAYAVEAGGPKEAKEMIQDVVEENAPSADD